MIGGEWYAEQAAKVFRAVVIAILVALVLGGLAVHFLPIAWDWIIPIIHAATEGKGNKLP